MSYSKEIWYLCLDCCVTHVKEPKDGRCRNCGSWRYKKMMQKDIAEFFNFPIEKRIPLRIFGISPKILIDFKNYATNPID
jgi:DNA-directed RNA polymerase subunit RPC12/RpoP